MEEIARQVWDALLISPTFTLSVITAITSVYGGTVWLWLHWRKTNKKTAITPVPLALATDNTVYLTVFHSHHRCFLYLASFIFGTKQYFTQFVNSICLLICLLQIHEHGDFRSMPALVIFAVVNALTTVWDHHSKLQIQSELNHQWVWKRATREKINERCVLVQQKTLKRGDLVPLELNRNAVIPADVRIVEGLIFVNEKELTGEDVAIPKMPKMNMPFGFRGTTIMKGKAVGEVIAVGNNCQMYQRSHEVQKPPTAVQKSITVVCMVNLYLLILISTLTAIVLYQQQQPNDNHQPLRRRDHLTLFWRHLKKMLLLLNTVIPLGLQFGFSAASKLLAHQVSRACQVKINASGACALNATTHVCSDKTGTLTLNQLKLAHVFPNSNLQLVVEHVLAVTDVTLNEKKELVRSDDMEFTLLTELLPQTGIHFTDNLPGKGGSLTYDGVVYERLLHAPYDHKREAKYSVLRHPQTGKVTLHIQGTPESILARSRLSSEEAQALWKKFLSECPPDPDSYHRIIAYGEKSLEVDVLSHPEDALDDQLDGLENLAFYCFHDRLVPGVSKSIQQIRQRLGFSVLTGDKFETCVQIATQLGLTSTTNTHHIATPQDVLGARGECLFINGRNLQDFFACESFVELVTNPKICKVVYRCSPFAKQLYVRFAQQHGGSVLTIGDGVNDISCCEESDLSVSVANGSHQLLQVTDIQVPDWNTLPSLLTHLQRQRLRIQNLTGWMLMKHLMTAGHLLALLCLSHLRLLKDPSNPLIMNLFNSSMFFIMCVHCYFHDEQTLPYSFPHLMIKGAVIGMISAGSAFEYFELAKVNDVIFILLSVQVVQLTSQMLRMEKERRLLPLCLYGLVCFVWMVAVLYLYGSTKLGFFLLQLFAMNYFFFQ